MVALMNYTTACPIQLGDSGHVHGLSLVVTDTYGDIAYATDRRGKDWALMPLHLPGAPGVYALSGTGPGSRIRGRVRVADGTLHSVPR